MVRTIAVFAALSLLGAAPLAHGQEAVPTAGGAGAHGAPVTPNSASPDTLDPPDEIRADDPGPLMGPCGPTGPAKNNPDQPDHKAHGEVFAGAGTHGYREAGGVVCQPIGDHSAVTVGVDVESQRGRVWGR